MWIRVQFERYNQTLSLNHKDCVFALTKRRAPEIDIAYEQRKPTEGGSNSLSLSPSPSVSAEMGNQTRHQSLFPLPS